MCCRGLGRVGLMLRIEPPEERAAGSARLSGEIDDASACEGQSACLLKKRCQKGRLGVLASRTAYSVNEGLQNQRNFWKDAPAQSRSCAAS